MTAQADSSQSPSFSDAETLLEAGVALSQGGDGAGAETLFRRALECEPDNATALYLLGLARFEAGAAAEAELLIQRLLDRRPHHAHAHFTLASIQHWRDDRIAAIAAYRRAAELDAGHVAARIGLARALSEIGDQAGAREAAQAAITLAPDDPAAHLALAAAWRGDGEVRKAAEAFADAVRIAPDLVTAHVGLSLAFSDAGDAQAAHASAERAVRLDPALCDAWLALGTALRGLHDPMAACEAFRRAAELGPGRAVVHLNLGLALIEAEQADAARRELMRVLELDPTSAKAHANLSSLFYLAGRKELAKAHALRALATDPNLMSAHQNLAALLMEEQRFDEARTHRDRAYTERNLVVSVAADPIRSVLVISTTESGNTPDRYLIPPASYSRLLWFIEYATEPQMSELPPFDVAFNAIGDEDLTGPTAVNAARFAQLCPTRLLNPPARISDTRRDLAGALFVGIDALVIPRTVRLGSDEVEGIGVREAARRLELAEPFLVRPVGSHGGKGLYLVGDGAPEETLSAATAYYLTEFKDFRSSDGFFRKYRMIFVDRRPYPYHLAIAPSWMVHYESSGMERRPDLLAEEAAFLDDPAKAIGERAMAAVTAVGEAMDLDYAGLDFSILPDGQVLLFEANATMLAHPEDPDGPLAHKNPAIERIYAAFQAMLKGA